MRPHVGAATLARFRQAGLNPRQTARIGAHLARCGRCSALDEELAGVAALLADVRPPPVPGDLTARIHAALTAEAASGVMPSGGKQAAAPPVTASLGTGPDSQAAASPLSRGAGSGERGGTRRRPHQEPGRGRLARWPGRRPAVVLSGLAAAAVLVAGGLYEVTQHGGVSPPPAGGPAARPSGSAARNGSRARAAPVVGPALPYEHDGRQESVTAVMTGTDFTPQQLSSQVAAEVVGRWPGAVTAGPNAMPPPAEHAPAAKPASRAAPFGKAAALAGCVNRIAAGELVVLVDVARYQGSRATVIVTEESADGPEHIWVVGTGCSRFSSDVLRHTALPAAG